MFDRLQASSSTSGAGGQYEATASHEEIQIGGESNIFSGPRTVRRPGTEGTELCEDPSRFCADPWELTGRSLYTRIGVLVTFSMLAGMALAFVFAAATWPRMAAKPTDDGEAASFGTWGQAPERHPALTVLKSDKFINAAADGVMRLGHNSKHLQGTELAKSGPSERHLLARGMTEHVHHFFDKSVGLSRMLSELELSEEEADALVHVVERMYDPEIFEVGLEAVHAAIEGVVPGVVSGVLHGGSLSDIKESITDTVLGMLPHQDYIRKLADELVPDLIRDDAAQRSMRKQVMENKFHFVMSGAAKHSKTYAPSPAKEPRAVAPQGADERRLFWQNTPINWFSLGAPVISASLGILLTTLMGRLPGYHEEANYAMWGVQGAAVLGDCLANIGYPNNVVNFAPCVIDVLFFGAEAAFVFVKPDIPTPAPTAKLAVCEAASDALELTLSSQTINNLGGVGPDTSLDPVMRFPSIGTYNGKNINMVISSGVVGTYQAADPLANGLFSMGSKCCTANINTQMATEFFMRIAFVDDSGEPVTVDRLQFTVFDFDLRDLPDNNMATLTIGGSFNYFTPSISTVNVTHNNDGTVTFTSEQIGDKHNNVADPFNLTPEQAQLAVGFIFYETNIIQGVYKLRSGFSGRNLQLAPTVQGICAYENFVPTPAPSRQIT